MTGLPRARSGIARRSHPEAGEVDGKNRQGPRRTQRRPPPFGLGVRLLAGPAGLLRPEAVLWGWGCPLRLPNTSPRLRADKPGCVTDPRTHMSVFNKEQAEELGINPSRKAVGTVRVTGVAECPLARTQLWVAGKKGMVAVGVVLSSHKENP